MALESLTIKIPDIPIPDDVERFIADADQRIDDFIHSRLDEPLAGFVPSDYRVVYKALVALFASPIPSGRLFCEWGSGFSVVAGLAAFLEQDAVAIEIERDLCDGAESLLEDHNLSVEVICGSLLPRGSEHVADYVEGPEWLGNWGADAYAELELEVEDFDVIFAYPWPGEEETIQTLFDNWGGAGAVLVTFRGDEGLVIHRRFGRVER